MDMKIVSKELAKRLDIEEYSHQERLSEAINLLLTHAEDKEELIQRIDNEEFELSGEIIGWAVKRQLWRDKESAE